MSFQWPRRALVAGFLCAFALALPVALLINRWLARRRGWRLPGHPARGLAGGD